jgi:ankyrin repeat protein
MGTTELFEAIDAGDAAKVRELVQQDPALAGARDDDGVSAVLHAHYRGKADAADAVLEARPELDVYDAAALGEVDRLRELLDRDPGAATSYSSDGFTALHLACFFEQPAAVEVLLEHGADVAAVSRNPMNVRALHSAAAAGQVPIVKLLLEHGADVNARQEGEFTALHEAARKGDAEMVDLLLAHGADTGAQTESGRVAAELASENGHTELAERLAPT